MVDKTQVQEAAAFLHRNGFRPSEIKPRDFAKAAEDLNKSFSELLIYLARQMQGGQGLGPAPITQAAVEGQTIA